MVYCEPSLTSAVMFLVLAYTQGLEFHACIQESRVIPTASGYKNPRSLVMVHLCKTD